MKFKFKIVLFTFVLIFCMVLNLMAFRFPVITQLVSLSLILCTGFLFVKIIRINSDLIDETLYALGISIFLLMFMGLLINTLYPVLGIKTPFKEIYIHLSFFALLFALLILYWIFGKDSSSSTFDLNELLDPINIFLVSVPFLTIIGVYLRNVYGNTLLLIISLLIISLVPILVAFNRIKKRSYIIAVLVISISLLFHTSLVTNYIWGWDIQREYYLANLVMKNGLWKTFISDNYNGMLSVTVLAPLISILTDLNLVWVFKTIYPVIFSFVPLVLFRFFEKQTESRVAFFAAFFFMTLFVFYTEMLALARQQIAELFLALILLVMADKKIKGMHKSLLFVIFSFSLVVSHYGLSYIFMLMLFLSMFLVLTIYSPKVLKKIKTTSKTLKIHTHLFEEQYSDVNMIRYTFTALFFTFALTWYMYVSGSSIFITIVSLGKQIVSSIFREFLDPYAAQGLATITMETQSPTHTVGKYLHIFFQFLIVVGMLVFLKTRKIKMERDYAIFAYIAFFICIASITVPYFASALNTTRVYQITLFFLAPFCVMGAMAIFSRLRYFKKNPEGTFSILLAIFLLFNTGWIYTVFNDEPSSFAIDTRVDYPLFTNGEIKGGEWVVSTNNETIYADEYRRLLFLGLSPNRGKPIAMNTTFEPGSYIYLGKRNLQTKEFEIYKIEGVNKYLQSTEINFYQWKPKKIYDSGDSVILQL